LKYLIRFLNITKFLLQKKFEEFTGVHQIYKSYQVLPKNYVKNLMSLPGFHQVFKFYQVFTRAKKTGEFTRFSLGF
jgi:hypothetical protein